MILIILKYYNKNFIIIRFNKIFISNCNNIKFFFNLSIILKDLNKLKKNKFIYMN